MANTAREVQLGMMSHQAPEQPRVLSHHHIRIVAAQRHAVFPWDVMDLQLIFNEGKDLLTCNHPIQGSYRIFITKFTNFLPTFTTHFPKIYKLIFTTHTPNYADNSLQQLLVLIVNHCMQISITLFLAQQTTSPLTARSKSLLHRKQKAFLLLPLECRWSHGFNSGSFRHTSLNSHGMLIAFSMIECT